MADENAAPASPEAVRNREAETGKAVRPIRDGASASSPIASKGPPSVRSASRAALPARRSGSSGVAGAINGAPSRRAAPTPGAVVDPPARGVAGATVVRSRACSVSSNKG